VTAFVVMQRLETDAASSVTKRRRAARFGRFTNQYATNQRIRLLL